ncbi:MAG TPA: spore coat associated protein CotJA [Candidatus Aphodoplasma excrementigallinarum]|uniref:Spore coat associated protein CotJA n=1 Tax=Candidatus Aphodoplasma excrementigallinarum TaxID=2840673 RepID=A0A9D1NHY9_9FIRM|nr:spore coat associated protein CotJA [Candidatus Aphodoplasma excrementigallinarum]
MDFDLTASTPMPRVGYTYVPMQVMGATYDPEKGLNRGTIFPELDIPMEKYGKQY